MERSAVVELHYMTPIENLASIARSGILSHARAAAVPHESVAMEAVQDLRAAKTVPVGRPLHEYVNLYFDARNAMMWLRRSSRLVVVRVSEEVLDLPNVVVSDGNAANGQTRFYPASSGLGQLDAERVYAQWWTDDDYWEHQERKRQRQAEVLVPDQVLPAYILGCYARFAGVVRECQTVASHWDVEVNRHVYFD